MSWKNTKTPKTKLNIKKDESHKDTDEFLFNFKGINYFRHQTEPSATLFDQTKATWIVYPLGCSELPSVEFHIFHDVNWFHRTMMRLMFGFKWVKGK